jgi:hypothetical protein
MIDIGNVKANIKCPNPKCGFKNEVLLRQIKAEETIICSGCKGSIHLVNYMHSYEEAENEFKKALEDAKTAINTSINLDIKF